MTDKKTEALKLALEALEGAEALLVSMGLTHLIVYGDAEKAITALREALAEQPAQQEPVVWMYVNKSTHEIKFQKHMRDFVDHGLWAEVPLYGEPLANHEIQCVCGAVWLGDQMVHLPDKRSPASKPEDIRNATLDEIATKIEKMPFGDTAASFAVWIREQKT